MKKRILVGVCSLAIVSALAYQAHITYRVFRFAKQMSEYAEYLDSKSECGLALAMDTRYEIVRNQGEQLYKANVWHVYANDIPACKEFYSRHMCWMLNVEDPVSLDKCGETFGYTKNEIEEMKKTKKLIERN